MLHYNSMLYWTEMPPCHELNSQQGGRHAVHGAAPPRRMRHAAPEARTQAHVLVLDRFQVALHLAAAGADALLVGAQALVHAAAAGLHARAEALHVHLAGLGGDGAAHAQGQSEARWLRARHGEEEVKRSASPGQVS